MGLKGMAQAYQEVNLDPWHSSSPKKNTKSPARQGTRGKADLNKPSKWENGHSRRKSGFIDNWEPELSNPLLFVLIAGNPNNGKTSGVSEESSPPKD